MTIAQHYKIVEILEPAMGEEKAKEFIKAIEEVIDAQLTGAAKVLATKEDIALVKVEIKDAKIDTIKWTISMFVIQTATILGFLYFMLKR